MDGLKYDDGKAPLHLVDMDVLIDVANVFGYGAEKYAEHNWRKGMKITRLLNAAMRHIAELQKGIDTDPESNHSHAAHTIANLVMVSALLRDMPECDDRYKKIVKKEPKSKTDCDPTWQFDKKGN
jgi:hypothetical protein